MGVQNHNAIIATTWDNDFADLLQGWIGTRPDCFIRSRPTVNGYQTFVMFPDGSKGGWPESETGDLLRDEFVERLAKDDYEDGSSPWDWVEVGFGECGQKVLRGNCINCYDDREYCD